MARSRLLVVALAAAAGLGMLGPAGAAAAAPSMIPPGCIVRDATLSWGFKESFRAYIESDIANGEWTTSRGATYETPEFSWSHGQGTYDPETGVGYVQFLGTVRFTGHEGLLDTTIADPSLSISPEGTFLLLDVAGPSMEGEQIDAQDVSFVELTGVEVSGEDVRLSLASDSVLTHDGEAAFPDYPAGTAFDPVTVALELDQCSSSTGYQVQRDDRGPYATILVYALEATGIVGILAAVVVAVVLLVRRGRARA
jgi:hypothetical protein